jgi:Secretion system C-terminal sorting domain
LIARIVDMSGKLVCSRELSSSQMRVRLDLSGINLNSGTYILQIIDGQKQYSSKVIKQ